MSFRSTLASWEYLAKKDALWAILSDPTKKGGRWNLDEFFAAGESEIGDALRFLEKQRLSPIDFEAALDFGCGVGRLSRALATRFQRVYGIDAAETMVSRARELSADRPNAEFVLNQEPRLDRFADGSISFVYTTLVLQHITYPESARYFAELLRILKPGGVAMIQTPTHDRTPSPLKLVRTLLRQVVRVAHLPLDALHMDMNVIPVREIEQIVERAGCEIVSRWSTSQCVIGKQGRVEAKAAAPRIERLVSEQFVVRRLTTARS